MKNPKPKSRKHGGFKVQVFCIWPDETTWHRDLYFPESIITTAAEAAGEVLGGMKRRFQKQQYFIPGICRFFAG